MNNQYATSMFHRNLHIVHVLIRQNLPGDQVGFLVFPHEHRKNENGEPILALSTKKTVADPIDPFLQGTSIEAFVNRIMHDELGVEADHYALAQELEPTELAMASPTHGGLTDYVVYPNDRSGFIPTSASRCGRGATVNG